LLVSFDHSPVQIIQNASELFEYPKLTKVYLRPIDGIANTPFPYHQEDSPLLFFSSILFYQDSCWKHPTNYHSSEIGRPVLDINGNLKFAIRAVFQPHKPN